ncbi:MarR family transcriptional regulator [Mesorhizobium sp. M8A.F.Ca.ET.208.01.1.1]|uniref:MarR family winged helix-turn-helix transcriptional regulator n=1 Tax=unclassified Mesorhizobium TaxID=325217 RepID=UPI00109372D2|nr:MULTISPECIES: MarR family transcriptional regulator [unclassified Mesorhizobium]TGQ89089.1 MarR family transcriptional regulator [Mesorhizobium sp. M8A.F.Ca.ET.208.01.1.1]TGR32194.1 MarR family transcriptional regulator [Mesorhizobium sp. M8A.F.Ca.ET.202.01.1.1]TGT50409.1 MarR family transcriptional regulator [Mesorhizobium sp. M8A.F.Ca.ET.167.01.1.1]TGU40072.1 MarR family transcriptional regulator [bacterium M00.F.Ca.ET.156.01.1.1]
MPEIKQKLATTGVAAKTKTVASIKQTEFSAPLTVSNPTLLVDGSDDSFRHVIYLFAEVLGKLTVCREAFGRQIGLTGSQFAVLFGVAYRQGEQGVTIKRLAQYVHLAPTHVTTEVGRLIRGGLLVKRSSDDDRRSVLVSLTAEGEKTVKSVAPFVTKVNDVLFEGMTAADLASAESLFTRLSRNSELALAQLKVAERENPID